MDISMLRNQMMLRKAGFFIASVLLALLGGCVAPEPLSKEVRPNRGIQNINPFSKSEEDLVFSAVKADYLKYGTEIQFDRLVRESEISIQQCSERYIVYFGRRGFRGFDGGSQVTVDRKTLQVNNSYYLPTACGPYHDYHVARTSG